MQVSNARGINLNILDDDCLCFLSTYLRGMYLDRKSLLRRMQQVHTEYVLQNVAWKAGLGLSFLCRRRRRRRRPQLRSTDRMDSEKWTIDSREYVLPDFMYNTVTAWLRVVSPSTSTYCISGCRRNSNVTENKSKIKVYTTAISNNNAGIS